MKKFELFMGHLGNGTTVCNKAVEENGDYKTVAHISDHGVIKLYVPESYIPAEAMEKIKNIATRDREKFMERWNRKSYIEKWMYMVNIPTIGCGYNAIGVINENNRHLSIEERVPLMEKVFFEMHM